jgi:hypothetical protein
MGGSSQISPAIACDRPTDVVTLELHVSSSCCARLRDEEIFKGVFFIFGLLYVLVFFSLSRQQNALPSSVAISGGPPKRSCKVLRYLVDCVVFKLKFAWEYTM